MKVLLTLYGEETASEFSPEQIEQSMSAWQEFGEAAAAAGVLLACEGLAESHAATTVRYAGGKRHVTDGPFIETKEQLGGFVFLEVRDLDEALEWADRLPWTTDGCSTEIRPIMDYDAFAAGAESATGQRAES
ncbi:YciI family protein [Candidatus Solirubrobacter pratensis]|uniref:YciI family protein n=1 Tax=Candidatus Solirubrobacter pratensis TaxID=1298857 RepID=UPI0003F9F7BA|nr:YciI family protein [Candidatus Solirubrobacter pratensis]